MDQSHLRGCYLNYIRILDTEHFAWSRLKVSGISPALDMAIQLMKLEQILLY